MKEILIELEKGSTILLETERLTEFWDYCKSQPDYYSFRYYYPDDKLVKITLTGKETIIKSKIID